MIPRTITSLPASVVVRGDPEAVITGITIDSRAVRPGDLFIAIRGGIEHVGEAVRAGAAAVAVDETVLERASEAPNLLVTFSVIRLLQCIGDVNAAASDALRIGITGSTGKTSTKDTIAHLIGGERRVVAALEGHNNEIGYPLTLARIEADTEVVVCELAMRGRGQIAELCAIASPDIAVITNIGVAHLELLESVDAIAASKAEIASGVREGGRVVIPFAEPLLDPYLPEGAHIITFGDEAGSDVQLIDRRPRDGGQSLTYLVGGDLLTLETNLAGRHHARNLAAALAVCRDLELDLDVVVERARTIPSQPMRGEALPLPGGATIVNDAYNANPASMEAALRLLAETSVTGRRIAVLGLMAELGPDTERYHREIGALATRVGVDMVVAVGPIARAYLVGARGETAGYAVTDFESAVELLAGLIQPGDRILVKGSKAAGLGPLPAALADRLQLGTA